MESNYTFKTKGSYFSKFHIGRRLVHVFFTQQIRKIDSFREYVLWNRTKRPLIGQIIFHINLRWHTVLKQVSLHFFSFKTFVKAIGIGKVALR